MIQQLVVIFFNRLNELIAMNCCSHNYDANDQSRDEARFRRRLRKFLTFNLVLFVLMILSVGISSLWKISIIWGAFLAISGTRIFNKDRDEPWDDAPKREQYGRPRRPGWRKKDLV